MVLWGLRGWGWEGGHTHSGAHFQALPWCPLQAGLAPASRGLKHRLRETGRPELNPPPHPPPPSFPFSRAGYDTTKENVTRWQPQVKRNREASTLVFNQRTGVASLSTGALTSKFTPSNEMEQAIAQVLRESGVGSAKEVEEKEALEMNKVRGGR